MENSGLQSKNKTVYITVAVVTMIVVAFAYWFYWHRDTKTKFFSMVTTDYIIPGVPYFGVWNRKGDASYMSGGDTASAVASIAEYWHPGGNNYTEISRAFSPNRVVGLTDGADIMDFLDSLHKGEYVMRQEKLRTEELDKYINSETRTPLLLLYPIDNQQPDTITYHPFTVVIGVKETERKVVMHNFWLGNNYEMSFDDFEKGWERMRPDERNQYYVIQPAELKRKIKEITSVSTVSYPARTTMMDESMEMFKDFALARGSSVARGNGSAENSIMYCLMVRNHPKFDEYFPPYFKTSLYNTLAENYLAINNLESAKEYAKLAIESNHDLDKPFKDWPGTDIRSNKPEITGQMNEPYRIMGDIQRSAGELDLAKEYYERALDIKPNSDNAKMGSMLVDMQLSSQLTESSEGLASTPEDSQDGAENSN